MIRRLMVAPATALANTRTLPVVSTLILALAAEFVAKMALEEDWSVTRLWAVACLVISGSACVYLGSILEDCRETPNLTPEKLRGEIRKSSEDIAAWALLGGSIPFLCGIWSLAI